MAEHKLSSPLPCVISKGRESYGGNQGFSHCETIKSSGCGLVAACDLLRYMHIHRPDCSFSLFEGLDANSVDLPNYNRLLDNLRSYFPLIPKLGINGLMLSLGINAFFLRNRCPYTAVWGVGISGLWKRVEEMLDNELPVIVGVGPDFPLIWQKHKADLYGDRAGQIKKVSSVRAHFMIITAIDDQWMTLSSWGKKYYMRRSDYTEHVRRHSGSFASNIVYIRKIRS